MKDANKNSNLLQSTERTLQILNLFSEQQPELSLTDISRLLDVSKQVTLKSLNTLQKHGFLRRKQDTKKYLLGFQLIKLGNLAQQSFEIKSVAHPILVELSKEVGESVYLLVPDLPFFQAICIDSVESPQTVTSRFRMATPLYAGSSKKVILAYLGEDYLNSMFNNLEITPLTKNTVTEKNILLNQLEEIRRNGYNVSYEETVYDAGAVAAPIFDLNGIAGSVAIYFPLYRFNGDKKRYMVDKLLQSTQRISKLLGYK